MVQGVQLSPPFGRYQLAITVAEAIFFCFQDSIKPRFYELFSGRVLVLDGAMGTMLQQHQLTAADFGGAALEGCNENLVRTRPDVVLDIHRAYLAAGADMVETNSFGGTKLVLAEYGLQDAAYELNVTAARLARQAADEFSSSDRPRFVAGAMGPTTKAITVTGGVTFRELQEDYYEQARALIEGGADLLLLETCQDTRNVKAALLAIDQLERDLGFEIPVMVSGTIEPMGTMLAGQTADAFCVSDRARRSPVGRAQLRDRSGVHDRPHPHHPRDGADARVVLPQCRAPERGGAVPGDAGVAGRAARALRRSWLAQHGGRLLRHDRRAHQGHRGHGCAQAPSGRQGPTPQKLLFGHRSG